mgnify:FL=1
MLPLIKDSEYNRTKTVSIAGLFPSKEWALFTKTEKRIILCIQEHNMNEEAIRRILLWPLNPMLKGTWRSHWSSIQKKMGLIRFARKGILSVEDGNGTTDKG